MYVQEIEEGGEEQDVFLVIVLIDICGKVEGGTEGWGYWLELKAVVVVVVVVVDVRSELSSRISSL